MRLISLFTALLCAALGLPVLGVLGAWFVPDSGSLDVRPTRELLPLRG